jgi:hypothetical protein
LQVKSQHCDQLQREMRTLSGEVSALKEQIAAVLRERLAEQLSTKFDEL